MLFDPAYWQMVAKGIDLDDERIGYFVQHHNHSRGIAREAILRSLLVTHTTHPFVISTGFVHDKSPYALEPKQCDVLVYDPREGQPYFRLQEFVVAPPNATRLAVEVKSDLDKAQFDKLVTARSTFCKPMLGFAFDGVTFDTFCTYLAAEVPKRGRDESTRGLAVMPECIAVHRKNYLGIRATSWSPSTNNQCYLAIDFTKVQNPCPGSATAYFMSAYEELLNNRCIHDGGLHHLFNIWEREARVLITPDGEQVPGGMAVP